MENRFRNVKTLEALYEVFATEEGVQEYANLSEEELERVAIVFEAKLPKGADMPDTPLTAAGYTYIWNVTIEEVETAPITDENEMEKDIMRTNTNNTNETINNNTNMEDGTMKNINEEVAATTDEEEVTMGEKAKEFAENAKEKLADGFKFITENVDTAAEEVKKMANMNDNQLEEYLKDNGKDILDKIVKAVKKYSGDLKKIMERHPDKTDKFITKINESDNIIELIKEVLDEEELNGWGKFKAIVKELIRWLLRLLLKVGAIVLKIAIVVAVGAIKVGAITLVTAGKAIGILNKEVIKPTVKEGKKAWTNHKINKAARAKAEAVKAVEDDLEDEFDDIEEALFEEEV